MPKNTYERVPLHKVRAGLMDRSEELCGIWLGNGRLIDGCWRVGDIENSPAKRTGSFSVVLEGQWRGRAKDWADPDRPAFDWLDIIEANIVPDDVRDTPRIAAIKWSINWLNLGGPGGVAVNRRQSAVATTVAVNDNAVAEDAARKIMWATRLWDEACPIDNRGNTPAELYLRNRAITITVTNGLLRYHPRCRYYAGRDLIGEHPALLAPIRRVDGTLCGVHRFYLTRDGYKADVPQVKKMLGESAGAAVRLVDDEDVRDQIGIAEGIETALSVMQFFPEMPVWAGLSTWGITTMALPRHVEQVALFYDQDEAQKDRLGHYRKDLDGNYIYPGLSAARNASARFTEEGRACHLFSPATIPGGVGCKDFNEALQKIARTAGTGDGAERSLGPTG